MKHVVKYDVYLDILLMVSIYVIKYVFLRESPTIQKSRILAPYWPGSPGSARPPSSWGPFTYIIYLLYLMECVKYGLNILVVSDGMF